MGDVIQLSLDLFGDAAKDPCLNPCMWLEQWHGHPFCYLKQTFRVRCISQIK